MKSSRMKFAKKLKSIRAAGDYLNQDRILQVLSAADGFSEFLPKITAASIWKTPQTLEGASECFVGDDQNVPPPVNQIPRLSCDRKDSKSAVSYGSKTSIGRRSFESGFRRPDMNSRTLFDPKLLEEFELAALCFKRINDFSIESKVDDEENDIVFPANVIQIIEKDESTLHPVMSINDAQQGGEGSFRKDDNTLIDRCPPGGEKSVVFYTTSLRGIRKTFDDCNMIRFLLDSFKVKYYERDISMHRKYREELRITSGTKETEVTPPILFIKGRCIGGAERVLCLHEQGKLRTLFEGIPIAGEKRCRICDGMRFMMCDKCRGSCRIVGDDGSRIKCMSCNENGLIVCVDCSS